MTSIEDPKTDCYIWLFLTQEHLNYLFIYVKMFQGNKHLQIQIRRSISFIGCIKSHDIYKYIFWEDCSVNN